MAMTLMPFVGLLFLAALFGADGFGEKLPISRTTAAGRWDGGYKTLPTVSAFGRTGGSGGRSVESLKADKSLPAFVSLAQTQRTRTSVLGAAVSTDIINTDFWVFVAGVFPFAWATVEFWSRIAVGKPFGTGKDSVYIGKDNAPSESRGLRTLDEGAFAVAYVLFAIAAGAIGLTLYSVLTSAPPDSLSPPSS